MAGLQALRRPEDVAKLRGLSVAQVLGLDDGPVPINGATGQREAVEPPPVEEGGRPAAAPRSAGITAETPA